jgi:hypothetical protein
MASLSLGRRQQYDGDTVEVRSINGDAMEMEYLLGPKLWYSANLDRLYGTGNSNLLMAPSLHHFQVPPPPFSLNYSVFFL